MAIGATETGDDPEVSVTFLGREREPLVVIDRFSGMRDELFERAQSAPFKDGGAHYPGLRAPASADFIDRRRDLVSTIMRDIFGLRFQLALEMLAFALVTKAPGDLTPLQRIPHYDSSDHSVIAGMFYLLGPQTGGTGFYRHRRTGFEAITSERRASYHDVLGKEVIENEQLEPSYCYGDSEGYELIGEVEAKPDRLALYRGRLLHSGIIPSSANLSSDPAKGRLTMNLFFRDVLFRNDRILTTS